MTTLRLGYNSGLTWLIPWQLGSLTNLQELSLTGCNLFGPIPPTFENLTKLTSLDVSFNYLSGRSDCRWRTARIWRNSTCVNNQLRGSLPSVLKDLPITERHLNYRVHCPL